MAWLIDTDVAIHLRDGSPEIIERIAALDSIPAMSVVTLVELEGGAAGDPLRRALLSELIRMIVPLPFGPHEVAAYGRIIAQRGHDRRKVLDRMIAAQALVAGRGLITINARDYAGIDGLQLKAWAAP